MHKDFQKIIKDIGKLEEFNSHVSEQINKMSMNSSDQVEEQLFNNLKDGQK